MTVSGCFFEPGSDSPNGESQSLAILANSRSVFVVEHQLCSHLKTGVKAAHHFIIDQAKIIHVLKRLDEKREKEIFCGRFGKLSPAISDVDTAETWQEVLDFLNAGEMPPEDEHQPPTAALAVVIGFLTDGLFEPRKRLPRRCLLREYGETTGATVVGPHPMAHFGAKTSDAYKQLVWRDCKVYDLLAKLLVKMKSVKGPDGGTLPDNLLIVMGISLRTGYKRRNLPILFAFGRGGGIQQGQHLVYKENETPLGNLRLSMLKHVGCSVDSFAGSNRVLREVFA